MDKGQPEMILKPTERAELEQALARHIRYLESLLMDTSPALSPAWRDIANRITLASIVHQKLIIEEQDRETT